MDQIMWIVTAVALALAVGMSFVAMRLLRGDRSRSAARVAALETAAREWDDTEDDTPAFVHAMPQTSVRRTAAALHRDTRATPAPPPAYSYIDDDDVEGEVPAAEPAFADYAISSPIDGDAFRAPSSAMFAATEEPKAPSRRWLALAAVAVVMAGVIGTGYVLLKPTPLAASASAAGANTASAPTKTAAATEPAARPIELLSLTHNADAGSFSITGLVQNPLDGAPLTHVIAVVYLFDKDGNYFANGKADVEFRGLRPGEESPFVVKIPDTARVGRYRVGFRREDGSVIAHVDKRGQAAAGLMTEGRGE